MRRRGSTRVLPGAGRAAASGRIEKATRTPRPEDYLRLALASEAPRERARFASRGLALRRSADPTIRALLFRQLAMARFEQGRFEEAYEATTKALALDPLGDVLHHDAARAALAAGDLPRAANHLEQAARLAPPTRRAFHFWTLGSNFFFAKRYDESIEALERATRFSRADRPLFRAHLALVRIAAGREEHDLQRVVDELGASRCARGYGQFVLGHLAYAAGAWGTARKYLETFEEGARGGRPAVKWSLAAELRMTRATLRKIRAASKRSGGGSSPGP